MKDKKIQAQEKINLQLINRKKVQKLKEKGITLIALVVTIIILLILAGVTLNMAMSGEGLFSRARNAADKYKKAQEDEAILIDEMTEVRRISTAEELQQLAAEVNEGNTFNGWTIILMNDIDLSSVCSESSGQSWIPIGSEDYPFKGIFDGNNKTISNLWINENSSGVIAGDVGLFGFAEHGKIENIKILGSITYKVPSDKRSIGGLVGGINSEDIHNVECNVSIDVDETNGNIGGVIGWAGMSEITDIRNLKNVTAVNGTNQICGGIVGQGAELSLDGCINNGDVRSDKYSRWYCWF